MKNFSPTLPPCFSPAFYKKHCKKHIIGLSALLLSFCVLSLGIEEFNQQVIALLQQEKTFETSKIDVQIKQIELDNSKRNYSAWKAELALDTKYTYWDNNKSTNSTDVYTKSSEKHSESAKLELTKRFLNNSSNLTVGIKHILSNENLKRNKQFNSYDSYGLYDYGNYYYFNWKYPLLKHDSNAKSLKTYHRNILDLAYKKLSFYEQQEDYLSKQLEQFLIWANYQEKSLAYQQHLQRVQNINLQNKKDQININSAIFKAQKNLSEVQAKLQSIKQALAIELDNKGLLNETVQIDWHKNTNIIKNTNSYLKNNARYLQKIVINQLLKKINIKYYQNQNLAKLDFYLNIDQEVTDSNTKTTESKNNKNIYTTSLVFEYPLFGNITNQTNLKINQLGLYKLEISYKDKLQNLNAEAQSLNISLTSNQKTLNQHLKLIHANQLQVQIVLDNYTHKNEKIKNLIDVLNEKKQSQLDYIDAGSAYQINIINYNNLLDRLINTPSKEKHSQTINLLE